MGETDYAYAVANIRANEYRLFTMAEMRRFVESASADDITRELESRGLGGSGERAPERWIYDYLQGLAQDSGVFDVFVMRNDFHNMKAAIKGRLTGADITGMTLLPCLLSIEAMEKCVERGEFSALPDWIKEPAAKAFTVAAETGDGQLCDIILDKAYLLQFKKSAEDSNNEFLKGLAEKTISLANLKTAVRACKSGKSTAFIYDALVECDSLDAKALAGAAANKERLKDFLAAREYGEAAAALDGSMTAFEKYCDDELLAYANTVKYAVFGIEPLIAHLIRHEAQSKNIQIILAGKRAGISERDMLERMRRTYA